MSASVSEERLIKGVGRERENREKGTSYGLSLPTMECLLPAVASVNTHRTRWPTPTPTRTQSYIHLCTQMYNPLVQFILLFLSLSLTRSVFGSPTSSPPYSSRPMICTLRNWVAPSLLLLNSITFLLPTLLLTLRTKTCFLLESTQTAKEPTKLTALYVHHLHAF